MAPTDPESTQSTAVPMVTYVWQRAGLMARYDVTMSRNGETRHGRFEQRGHSCLAGIVSVAAFAVVAAGFPWLVISACDSLGVAHPFDMDRHSLWLVGLLMILVGVFSFGIGAMAGKLVDPQKYRMLFDDGDDCFEVVNRAGLKVGVAEYFVRDERSSYLGEVLEQTYSGRVQFRSSATPEVVVSYVNDNPSPEDLETGVANRPDYGSTFWIMLQFILLMPFLLISPIWIGVRRVAPNDKRRRCIRVIDPKNPGQLVEAGELNLHYERNILRSAELNIDSTAAEQHRLVAAAVSVLFVDDISEGPTATQNV